MHKHDTTQAVAAMAAFADIIPLLDHLPPTPPAVTDDMLIAQLDRYNVKAGPLLPLLLHLQRWQKRTPTLQHPRLCVFASYYPDGSDATAQMIHALQNDHHPLKQVATILNADLQVYELDLAHTTRDAMQAAKAMTYGMMAIEEKCDAVVIASLSDGAEHAAAALAMSETDADAILTDMATQIGLDFYAALGACLAARLAQQPVLVSGRFGEKLIAVLNDIHPGSADHVYLCTPFDMTQTMLPVFTPVQQLQQIRFLLSFLPAPLKTVHVRAV